MVNKPEKIINNCIKLLEKGYGMDYCLNKYNRYRRQLEDYFKAIDSLKNLKKIEPDKSFTENSFDKIYDKARKEARDERLPENNVESVSPTIPARRKFAIFKPAIIFVIFLVIAIFSFSGTIYASQDSVPGQTLYPVKRSFEDFKLIIYPESRKGALHFQYLNNRLSEANILIESDEEGLMALIEDLLLEIDNEYNQCHQYRCFMYENEENMLNQIGDIKNRYHNKFGQGKNKDDPGRDSGNQEDENYNGNNHNTSNKEGGPQHKKGQNK